MLELYHAWNSTCSQKVRLCLAEKGLAWKGHVLNLRAFDQVKPAFLALNPAAMVPVLVDDGFVLTESRIISEYLEDAHPGVPLAPADARARARMRLWTKYVDDVATEAIKIPSFLKNIRPAAMRLPDAELEAAVSRMPDRRKAERWRRAAREGYSEAEVRPSIELLEEMLRRMERDLGATPWLAGERLSLADLDMAPFVHRLARIDLGGMIEAHPAVSAWYARIAARESFRLTFAFETAPPAA